VFTEYTRCSDIDNRIIAIGRRPIVLVAHIIDRDIAKLRKLRIDMRDMVSAEF
jgi:hypothetical protein